MKLHKKRNGELYHKVQVNTSPALLNDYMRLAELCGETVNDMIARALLRDMNDLGWMEIKNYEAASRGDNPPYPGVFTSKAERDTFMARIKKKVLA